MSMCAGALFSSEKRKKRKAQLLFDVDGNEDSSDKDEAGDAENLDDIDESSSFSLQDESIQSAPSVLSVYGTHVRGNNNEHGDSGNVNEKLLVKWMQLANNGKLMKVICYVDWELLCCSTMYQLQCFVFCSTMQSG